MTTKTSTRIKATGEIFTPTPLVNEILDKLPSSTLSDPSKSVLDPACGNGQFLIEVLKRRNNLNNIFGVDLMADNTCDTIARLLFYNKFQIDIFDDNAQPIPELELDDHKDNHSYYWLKDQPSFERYYIVGKYAIAIRMANKSPTAIFFEFSWNMKTWTPFKQIACADSLKFNYDEFNDVF